MSFKFVEEIPFDAIQEQAENFLYDNLETRGAVDLIIDGQKHRIALNGDKGRETSGLYCFYSDHCPAGYVRDFRNDIYLEWQFDFNALKESQPSLYRQSKSPAFKAEAKQKQRERAAQEAQAKQEALRQMKIELDGAQPATDEHPYLKGKGRKAHGLKLNAQGSLLIPLHDISGKLKGLQHISTEGEKLFETGSDISGAFHVIGGHELKERDNFIIAEGFATAAAIYEDYEATQPELLQTTKILAAMNCGNLPKVTQAIKTKFKPKCLLIAADDDSRSLKHKEKGDNPGVEHAKKSMEAGANGYLIPDFDVLDWGEDTDFCDFAQQEEESGAIAEQFIEAFKKFTPRPWLTPIDDLIDNYKPTEWLIKHWLPAQSQTRLFAESGAGKSFIAVDMAASIAAPDIESWHGLKVKHGQVIYLCGEGNNGLNKRFIGWKQAHGVKRLNLIVSNAPEYIDDDGAAEKIISEIKEVATSDLKLIIVDTLSRHLGGDENSASDASKFLNNLSKIQREFQCAVMIIHHSGVADKSRGRGSSAFKAGVDMELTLTNGSGIGAGSELILEQVKNKDSEKAAPLSFIAEDTPLDWCYDEDGEQEHTLVLKRVDAPAKTDAEKIKLTSRQKLALETYIKAAQAGGTFKDNKFYGVRNDIWRDEVYKRSSSDNDSTRRGDFSRAKKAIVEDLGLLINESRDNTGRGYIYKPVGKFFEYIEATGLKNEFSKIDVTSRSEAI